MSKTDNLAEIKKQFAEFFSNPKFEIEVIQDDKLFDLERFDQTIISEYAVWSGYTQSIGKSVLSHLEKSGAIPRKFIFLDVDYISEDLQTGLFGRSNHGYFSSIWKEKNLPPENLNFQIDMQQLIEFISTRLENNT